MNLRNQLFSYSAINILNAGIPFLLLPILTRYLTTEEYGTLSLLQMIVTVSFPLMMLNSQTLIVIDKSNLSSSEHKNLTLSILSIALVSFVFLETFLIPFSDLLGYYLGVEPYILYYIPALLLFQVLPITLPLYFQAIKDPINYGKVKLTLSFLNMTFSILFVVFVALSWKGRLLGMLIAYIVVTFGCLFYLKRNCFFNIINFKPYLKSAIKFGVPLIPHTIAGILLSTSDRFIITALLGKEQLGIYSVAFQISVAVSILMASINQAWAPHMYEKLKNLKDYSSKRKLVLNIYKLMAVMLALALIFVFFVPFIFKIFISDKFSGAVIYSQVIAFAFMFQGWYFLMSNFIFHNKKSSILSFNTLISLTISLVLNFLLLPEFGLMGAAFCMLIVYFYLFLSIWLLSSKQFKLPWFSVKGI